MIKERGREGKSGVSVEGEEGEGVDWMDHPESEKKTCVERRHARLSRGVFEGTPSRRGMGDGDDRVEVRAGGL